MLDPSKLMWVLAQALPPPVLSVTAVRKGLFTVTASDWSLVHLPALWCLLLTGKVVMSLTKDVDCACFKCNFRYLPPTSTMVHCCRTASGSVHSSPHSQPSLQQCFST